eukprot:CAMPEP_0173293974 /NCGR_PEP_ID=MMETSP1143-20121109/13615_1 /TAXON_ID=483371 /ORGANISM="non described non described, Strain CCMP2298" /LENGTH=234 /DNA_ID=CAMNT_0014233599 /DNA_START=93 /DNA_END=797 /DNA_ORIENTATION=+
MPAMGAPLKDEDVTPLPTMQILCVVFIQMCEAMNVNVLFPFLAFSVEDYGYTGEALGYHAGALAASFCAAQFITSVPWGMVSDRFGRKPAVVAGTLGAAVGMLVFGMAKTYPMAIFGRMLSGFLSGNLGVVKSFLTEITDDTNRGAGFSYMSLAWAVGTIIAPLAGADCSQSLPRSTPRCSANRVFLPTIPTYCPACCASPGTPSPPSSPSSSWLRRVARPGRSLQNPANPDQN